jgi:tripartite-type tricarboxylate transporter receptor subunit TctC
MPFARRTLLAALAIPAVARAQSDYPSRQVRIVVPFPAGGGLDALARALAERLQAQWRQPVVVDNRPAGRPCRGRISSRRPRRMGTRC